MNELLTINRMVYNPPMTIAIWSDGTKTTARCEDKDTYNKELGFALCVMKKKYGNKKVRNMLNRYVYANSQKSGNAEIIKTPTVKAKRPTFRTTIRPHTEYIVSGEDLIKEALKVFGLI